MTTIQVVSHIATFYSLGTFVALVQPAWLSSGKRSELFLVIGFWVVFALSLCCYSFVCFGDIRFHEEQCPISNGFEARQCDDCGSRVTRRRVKHCQTCGSCVLDFDHHCRYLNVCIGGTTYKQWFLFVVGLAGLMSICASTAVEGLKSPERFVLAEQSLAAFYAIVGLQAVLSLAECIFLICLLAQHIFFIFEGTTTLEYIKDQAPGFPSLPPHGWREAVSHNQCHVCHDYLELMTPLDPNEVWFCSICQGDLAKAGVEFLTCCSCDNVNICLLCQRVSEHPGATVVSYRASVLKKRSEVEARMRAATRGSNAATPSGNLKGVAISGISRVSSMSGREHKQRRRSITALVAAIEGDAGDAGTSRAPCCRYPCWGSSEADKGAEADNGSSSGSDI